MPSATRVHSHESQVYIDNTLIRGVQSFSYDQGKNTEAIRKLGSYKTMDFVLNSDQPIDTSIEFILNNHILSRTNNYLKLLTSTESTIQLKDVTARTTFSKANLTSFSLDFNVGSLALGSYNYQCDSLTVDSSNSLIDLDLDSSKINIFRPQDISVTSNFNEGLSSSSFAIQGINISTDISREPTVRVGQRGAIRRYPVLPSEGSLTISIIKNNVDDTMDLSKLVTEKGDFTFLMSETALGTASTNPNLNIKVYNCFLDSVNHSHDLDGNASLNFVYTFPIANDSIEYYFS